jgi:hypothetical protein
MTADADPRANEFPIYGFPEECKKFEQRNPEFYPRLPRLVDALNLAFTRIQENAGPEDKFVYLYGSMCVEDFMEIVLVSMHGYGAAAMKLLRSMYEHTVTLRYLFENQEEIQTFMDYNLVQQDKLMKPVLHLATAYYRKRPSSTSNERQTPSGISSWFRTARSAVRKSSTIPGASWISCPWRNRQEGSVN